MLHEKPPYYQDQHEIKTRKDIEAMVDETVDESFPASDPPAWDTLQKRLERCNQEESVANPRPEASP